MPGKMCSSHISDGQIAACRPARGRGLFSLWPGLLLLLLGFTGLAKAEFTGVAFELSDTKSDWEFSESIRETKITSLTLQIEERTESGFSVGAGIGFMTIRVDGNEQVETQKFDGEYLEIYLRQDFSISESFSLDALLNYGFYSGDENTSSDRDDISWNQLGLEFGASFQHSNLRITPFVSYTDVDGDISGDDPTETFSLEDEIGYGLRLDFFTESTAFVRLQLQTGSHNGGYINFVRRY
jgi:hypothetical protein